MANPTLISQVTPYRGWTLASAAERLLATRGLTEDSSTGRTIATASESAAARERIRRAVADLHQEFPGVFSDRTYTVTWTVGDHSAMLPADFSAIRWVKFADVPLAPLDDEAMLRDQVSVDGGVTAANQLKSIVDTRFYRISGVVDNDGATPLGDYRLAIRLYEQPTAAQTLEVRYISKAPALTVEADDLPYDPIAQEWILNRARLLWGTDENDQLTKANAEKDLAMAREKVAILQNGSHERRGVFRWKYPNVGARYPRR